MEDLPAVVLGELFPGCDSMPKMLSMLEHIDRGGMTKLAVRLLAVLPEQFCRMVSSLSLIHISSDTGKSGACGEEIFTEGKRQMNRRENLRRRESACLLYTSIILL